MRPVLYHFLITNDGVITFPDRINTYQLSKQSRTSFFGLWLEFELSGNIEGRSSLKKQNLFLFHDSLTRQDYSHLISIIRGL